MATKKIKSGLYKMAGVDIDLAQKLLEKIKKKLARAKRPEMLAPIGGFGGLFKIDMKKYKNPVLVSSIDGVGTKLLVAQLMGSYYTIGHDIVNHCINDIAVQGAEPIYFMDYIGMGRLRNPIYKEVLSGIADACISANCALLGGETAEMPGMYGDDFDVVGVITGIVEKNRLITGSKIKAGQTAIGIASNGLHTNGYSLARQILFEKLRYSVDTELLELGETIGEALLKSHTSYWPAIKYVMQKKLRINGMAHITGGGLYDNVPRVLPEGIGVIFKKGILPVPPIIKLIVEEGGISESEAYRVFNMGIGMVWFIEPQNTDKIISMIREKGFIADIIGETVASQTPVKIL